MENDKKNQSAFDTVVGWIIGAPIAIIVFVLSSPLILYHIVIKGPLNNIHKKNFFKRNTGKTTLCISPGKKYRLFKNKYLTEIMDAGIDNVVEFDCEKSSNRFDDYEWDHLISRDAGFPLLVKFRKDAINQCSLKNDFNAFFKNEIDWVQLKGTIKKIAKSNDK